MGTTATLRLDETEKAIIQNYASSKGMTMSEFMKKVVLDYIEDEYDLKIYKEYLKEKENGEKLLKIREKYLYLLNYHKKIVFSLIKFGVYKEDRRSKCSINLEEII